MELSDNNKRKLNNLMNNHRRHRLRMTDDGSGENRMFDNNTIDKRTLDLLERIQDSNEYRDKKYTRKRFDELTIKEIINNCINTVLNIPRLMASKERVDLNVIAKDGTLLYAGIIMMCISILVVFSQ